MKHRWEKFLLLAGIFCLGNASISYAEGWQQTEIGYWWEDADRGYPVDEWREIDNEWYYFNQDGYMVHDAWVGNYYLGSDGKMLKDTRTPDNYYVGADGAWIPDELPVAEYYAIQMNPDMRLDYFSPNAFGYGYLYMETSQVKDHGQYYEVTNQELRAVNQYETKQSREYGEWIRLNNGKYACLIIPDYESHIVYEGSIYVNKNAKVNYYRTYKIDDGTLWGDIQTKDYQMSFGDYIGSDLYDEYKCALIEIVSEDDKGYVTEMRIMQGG